MELRCSPLLAVAVLAAVGASLPYSVGSAPADGGTTLLGYPADNSQLFESGNGHDGSPGFGIAGHVRDVFSHESTMEEADSPLSLSSTNEYPSVEWSPWSHHLAEPYREAVLKAESSVGNPESDLFMWTFPGPGEHGAVYEGRFDCCADDQPFI